MRIPTKAVSAAIAGVLAIATPFVAGFEGLNPKAYLDPVGVPTICYGHTAGVAPGLVYSKAKCDEILHGELAEYIIVVDSYTTVPMPDTRRAALASFAYNVGAGNFKRSNVLRKLNAGDVQGGCDSLRKWVYAKGQKLPGLVRRREAERELCLMREGDEAVYAEYDHNQD